MTARTADDPHQLGHGDAVPISERGPAPKHIVVAYGFWIFLLSDFVLFSGLFASYAVLTPATAGGPHGRDLFDLPLVALETSMLLLSSFTCGLAGVAMMARKEGWFQVAMAVTALLGLGFLAIELTEFARLIANGNGPQRSAFLSAFFALVGCHGIHVAIGLLWLTTMIAQVRAKGFRDDIERRTACFMLFWHALDIIWVALFTMVYLLGVYA
ncbi:cytochrome o ubiquinol oxidase subunit III [Sphingomonas panacisoli]|uniref:Cytochrome bo(3) ubiquinol oxidase subunit 3 n=1 Tax=Sphingomonas panacisoli TaxID=1813879 RepID=A0A5B8LJ50_9SPHN|nr:cytochrome o ubiquinol oxidase subunit III [Sphingomonas panacisoli]QDZ08121.1 cytochrome o ubiquinol oxidase subunit III [Sphingomonas panacisoli]